MSAATDSATLHATPTAWRVADEELRAERPQAPWSWLLEPGSLTRRLHTACPGDFALQVIGERPVTLAPVEARLLDVAPGSPARIREVHLACGSVHCIYALSLLPQSTLDGGGSYLARLGDRPLGDALFSDPKLERGAIEVTCLQPGDGLHGRIAAGAVSEIWGRRSVFRTGGSPLLVSEFFLPGLFECAG